MNVRRGGVVRNIVKAKGFAFVTPDDGGPDVFVHSTSMLRPGAFDRLILGTRVTFETQEATKGPRAESVEIDA